MYDANRNRLLGAPWGYSASLLFNTRRCKQPHVEKFALLAGQLVIKLGQHFDSERISTAAASFVFEVRWQWFENCQASVFSDRSQKYWWNRSVVMTLRSQIAINYLHATRTLLFSSSRRAESKPGINRRIWGIKDIIQVRMRLEKKALNTPSRQQKDHLLFLRKIKSFIKWVKLSVLSTFYKFWKDHTRQRNSSSSAQCRRWLSNFLGLPQA